MSDIVQFILAQKQAQIKEEIAGKPLSIVLDEIIRLGEAMMIVTCFISPDWSIQQSLTCFQLLALPKASQVKELHGYC